MDFQIVWTDSADKSIKKLPWSIAKRIYDKVGNLKTNPYHHLQRLVGSSFYKLRVGDYRVIVDIQAFKLIILVVNVGHRKNVYG